MDTQCARCEASVAVDQAYFSAAGEVCFRCNTELEAESSAAFTAGAEDSMRHGGPSFLSIRRNPLRSLFGPLFHLIRRLFNRP